MEKGSEKKICKNYDGVYDVEITELKESIKENRNPQNVLIEMDMRMQMNPLYVSSELKKTSNNKNDMGEGEKNNNSKQGMLKSFIIGSILLVIYGIPTYMLYNFEVDKYLNIRPITVNTMCLVYTVIFPWMLENYIRTMIKNNKTETKTKNKRRLKKVRKEHKMWLLSKMICMVLLYVSYLISVSFDMDVSLTKGKHVEANFHQCNHNCLKLSKYTTEKCSKDSRKGYGKGYLDIGNATQKEWLGTEIQATLSEIFDVVEPNINEALNLLEAMMQSKNQFYGIKECVKSAFGSVCDMILFHAISCNPANCTTELPSMENFERKFCRLRELEEFKKTCDPKKKRGAASFFRSEIYGSYESVVFARLEGLIFESQPNNAHLKRVVINIFEKTVDFISQLDTSKVFKNGVVNCTQFLLSSNKKSTIGIENDTANFDSNGLNNIEIILNIPYILVQVLWQISFIISCSFTLSTLNTYGAVLSRTKKSTLKTRQGGVSLASSQQDHNTIAFMFSEKIQLLSCLLLDIMILSPLIYKLYFDFEGKIEEDFEYKRILLLYATISCIACIFGLLQLILVVKIILRGTQYLVKKSTKRKTKQKNPNPFIHLYKLYYHYTSIRTGKYFYLKTAIWEIIEILTQVVTFDEIGRENDLVYTLSASLIIGLNLILSPILFYFKYKVYIFVCDGFLDLCFFILNMVYFTIENLNDSRTNFIVLCGTLLPAFRLEMRVRSILKYISRKTHQRTMAVIQRNHHRVLESSDVLPHSTGAKVMAYVSKSGRVLRTISRNPFVSKLVVVSSALLGFSIIFAIWIQTFVIEVQCANEIGRELWNNARPRYIFFDGMLIPPRCNYRFIKSINATGRKINILSPAIHKLINLEELDLRENNIEELPLEIIKLSEEGVNRRRKLKYINLDGNPVSKKFEWNGRNLMDHQIPWWIIFRMNNTLETINFDNNKIQTLPERINILKKLKTLSLKNNQIKQLPINITASHLMSSNIALDNNPVTFQFSWTNTSIKYMQLHRPKVYPNSLDFVYRFNDTLQELDLSMNNNGQSIVYENCKTTAEANDICAGKPYRHGICSKDLSGMAKNLTNLKLLNLNGQCLIEFNSKHVNKKTAWVHLQFLDLSFNPMQDLDDDLIGIWSKSKETAIHVAGIQDRSMILTDLQLIDNPFFINSIFRERVDTEAINVKNMDKKFINLNEFCIFKSLNNFLVTSEGTNYFDSQFPTCFEEMKNLLVFIVSGSSCGDYKGASHTKCAGNNTINSKSSVVATKNERFPLGIFELPSISHIDIRDYNRENLNPRNHFSYLHEAPAFVSPSLQYLYTTNFCFHKVLNETTTGRFRAIKILAFDQLRDFKEFYSDAKYDVERADYNNMDCRGTLPVSINKLARLEKLFIRTLYMEGNIPFYSFFRIKTLQRLEIYSLNEQVCTFQPVVNASVRLTGELNFTDFKATKLQYLAISQTYITGAIPSEIANLKSLIKLDLSKNYLVGNISIILQSWKHLNNLKILNLAGNKGLYGTLPKEVLNRLEFLDISGTNITLDADYNPEETKQLTFFIYNDEDNGNYSFGNAFVHQCKNMKNKKKTSWYQEFRNHYLNNGDPHWHLYYGWLYDHPKRYNCCCRKAFEV